LDRARHHARVLSAVAHPNISLVHDLGELPDGIMYVVMDRLRGVPLKLDGSMDQDEARDILSQLLSALHAAHVAGSVHGNLRPSNVFLCRRAACSPVVKVLDFGSDPRSRPRYMSPESLGGAAFDPRSDLWASGVILYRMLTGHHPFPQQTIPELLSAIEARPASPPSARRAGISKHWDSVIARALDRDSKRRFADALEFADALRDRTPSSGRVLLPSLVSVPPPSYAERDGQTVHGPSPDFSQENDIEEPVFALDRAPLSRLSAAESLMSRLIAGKYKLESLLGTGSAGAVYRAIHQDLGRKVAVKILHKHNRDNPHVVRRFKVEARVISTLDHVNVTRILDFGEERDGLLYLVMEYVAGPSLETLIASQGKIPTPRVLTIGIQVCNALVAAHKLGITHRDIKPENILLITSPNDTDGADHVKVCDFGTAKLRVASELGDVTGARMLCGSPAYMSPEQARCEEIDHRADIYSLGVTLYEALVGELPIVAPGLAQLLFQTQSQAPVAPSTLLPGIDPLLEDILLRMLEKDPNRRHQTAREVRGELREVAAQFSPKSEPKREVLVSKSPPA
jgi:serine/threonine protein kinase